MANIEYVTENRLTAEVWQTRARVALIGGGIALLLTLIVPGLWWVFLLAAVWLVFQFGARKVAGAQGEDQTLATLRRLPDDHTLFNQLDIPSEHAPRGAIEADLVVVGPNGLWVIETKHHHGTIFGTDSDPTWRIEKVGRRGGEYETTLRNPIRQVKGQVMALKAYLAQQGIQRVWIDAVVVFSHAEASLRWSGPPPKAVSLADAKTDLVRLLTRDRPRQAGLDPTRVVAALARLRPIASLEEGLPLDRKPV